MLALISILPLVLLFVLMLGFKVSASKSALLTLVSAVAMALCVAPAIGIVPEELAGESVYSVVLWALCEGMFKAVFPILLIILMAIYSYNVMMESGAIEVVKRQFSMMGEDRGILVLIITWGFGGLLEGMAGFGTAVAIPAAILIGLGFKPVFSALVALLANSVTSDFGAVGVPILTLCNEISPNDVASAQSITEVSAFVVIQLLPLFVLIPFAILMIADRRAWLRNIFIALWTGIITLVVQMVCVVWVGYQTPSIISSLVVIVSLVAFDKIFITKTKHRESVREGVGFQSALKAWSVYFFILLFILVSGPLCPPVNQFLKTHLVSSFSWPVLGAGFRFGWLDNAALMILIGSVLGGLIQGLTFKKLAVVMARTLLNLRNTALTIISLIALASVMKWSGMISAIAVGLVTVTGSYYPFFAPVIGALGSFVTGSNTSSNILFGKLQVDVASHLGMNDMTGMCGIGGAESNWLAASNVAGATGGKMICPQSIAVATAACNMKDADDEIMRRAIPYALVYILICGLMVYFAL